MTALNGGALPQAPVWISRCNGSPPVLVSAGQAAIDIAHAHALNLAVIEIARPDGAVVYAWTLPNVADASAPAVRPPRRDRTFTLEPVGALVKPAAEPTAANP